MNTPGAARRAFTAPETAPRRGSPASRSCPFVIFYSAWEALQGIGTGILVD